MRVRAIILVLSGLLPCCWADFPQERLNQDASAPLDVPSVDRSSLDQSTIDQDMPVLDRDMAVSDQDLASGDLAPTVDQPRPDISVSCDPLDPPWCEFQVLVTCTPAGETQASPCPLGCEAGECCTDSDNDQAVRCKTSGGDCDDLDPLVFPGQTDFFEAQRGDGTYDYNCDEQDEPELVEQIDCQKYLGDCIGDGWVGNVPDCGEWGSFSGCTKVSGDCEPDVADARQQACR